jgi:predicted secreted Zn-dependent protease
MTFTPQMLIDQIRVQPEPVLRELWHYMQFLDLKRQEEEHADVLPGREIEQEILDILDADASTTR